MVEIKILDDIKQTKNLYKEVFVEDDDAFIDYYYNKKMDNTTAVCALISNTIVGMIHLNKYKLIVNGEQITSYYIVAVACKKEYRRRGIMRQMLNEAFLFMYKRKIAFTFLLPANKDYYLPFDFTFITEKTTVSNDFTYDKKIKVDINELYKYKSFILEVLAKYNIYCIRDDKYLKDYMTQLESQNAYMYIYYNNDSVIMLEVYWGKNELRERFVEKKFLKNTQPYYMGRVINVESFLQLLKSKKAPIELAIKVIDPIINENNAVYICNIGNDITVVRKEKICKYDIEVHVNSLFDFMLKENDNIKKCDIYLSESV